MRCQEIYDPIYYARCFGPLCASCEHSLMAIRVSFCSSPPAFAFGGILKEGPYEGSDMDEGRYGRTRDEIYNGTLPGVVLCGARRRCE